MYLGAYVILARPLLVEIAKATVALPTDIKGLTTSDLSNEANTCTDHAIRLINSSTSMLLLSLPPKRVFLPVFFLVYAIHFVILGIFTKLSTHSEGGSSPDIMQRQTLELTAVDAGIRALQFYGQQNLFARKYSSLIKELRQQLEGVLSNNALKTAFPLATSFSAPSNASFQTTTHQDLSTSEPMFRYESLDDALIESSSPGLPKNYEASEHQNTQDLLSQDVELIQRHVLPKGFENLSLELPWSMQNRLLSPGSDSLSIESPDSLLNADRLMFLESIWEEGQR
jgi:hypothetical protein